MKTKDYGRFNKLITTPDKSIKLTNPPVQNIDSVLSNKKNSQGLGISPDIIDKIRKNPQAAREAFLYAEIFSPPACNKY